MDGEQGIRNIGLAFSGPGQWAVWFFDFYYKNL